MKDLTKKYFKKESSLVISEIDKEAIIYKASSGVYFKTNQVGSYIFNILNNKISFSDILQKTSNNFEIIEKDISEDIKKFLFLAQKQELIEINDK